MLHYRFCGYLVRFLPMEVQVAPPRFRLKRCPDCGITKSIQNFPQHKNRNDGHGAYCKTCTSIQRSAYDRRGYDLKYRYGVEMSVIDDLVLSQEGRCAICELPSLLVVDHDHKTNEVRQLLCHHCNMLLGFAKDDPATLEAAAAYIRRHS